MKSTADALQEPTHSIVAQEAALRYYDKATKLKIEKHLTDINDTITEEDIRNIDTNITLSMLGEIPTE